MASVTGPDRPKQRLTTLERMPARSCSCAIFSRVYQMMLQLSREHADNSLLKKVIFTSCIIGIERSNCISRPID